MEALTPLFEIVRRLRGETGCAWDRRQTPLSMITCLIEESYELQDAILAGDIRDIAEEIGDVLFLLVFILEIFQEKKQITTGEVVGRAARKMIRRHPHVYGRAKNLSQKELFSQWDEIKKKERLEKGDGKPVSSMARIPSGMPSMARAFNVSKLAVKKGFDWDSLEGVLKTAGEEMAELRAAFEAGDGGQAMMELGDVLFTLVNVARFAGFHPETALAGSTRKFEGRFKVMEEMLEQNGRKLDRLSRAQKDRMWDKAKSAYDR